MSQGGMSRPGHRRARLLAQCLTQAYIIDRQVVRAVVIADVAACTAVRSACTASRARMPSFEACLPTCVKQRDIARGNVGRLNMAAPGLFPCLQYRGCPP